MKAFLDVISPGQAAVRSGVLPIALVVIVVVVVVAIVLGKRKKR